MAGIKTKTTRGRPKPIMLKKGRSDRWMLGQEPKKSAPKTKQQVRAGLRDTKRKVAAKASEIKRKHSTVAKATKRKVHAKSRELKRKML